MKRGIGISILSFMMLAPLALGLSPYDLLEVNATFTLYGQGGEQAGHASDYGDINGDGYLDFVTSSRRANADEGEVHIIYGSANYPADIIMTSGGVANVTIRGPDTDDFMGTTIVVADFNNDSYADIATGASLADGPGVGTSCGSGVGDLALQETSLSSMAVQTCLPP